MNTNETMKSYSNEKISKNSKQIKTLEKKLENIEKFEENTKLKPILRKNTESKQNFFENKVSIFNNSKSQENESSSFLIELKKKIKTIFNFYCCYGDRNNLEYLKSNKFHKMMVDAKIKDRNLTQKKLDLIYVKFNKHLPNMEFQTFLNTLPEIAKEKYFSDNKNIAFEKIINNNFFPLYQKIINETDIGFDIKKFTKQIDEKTIELLRLVSPILLKIYTVTFTFEPKNCLTEKDLKEKSFSQLKDLLKDYELCPDIINKTTSYHLFDFILKNKETINFDFINQDLGTLFTFGCFLQYLTKTSEFCFDEGNKNMDIENENYRAKQLLDLLFKMEFSPGFASFQRKNCHTQNKRNTLLIPNETILQVLGEVPKDYEITNNLFNYEDFSPNKTINSMNSFSKSDIRQKSLTKLHSLYFFKIYFS